jgi:two-component system phosphate regulon response regulator PhoB
MTKPLPRILLVEDDNTLAALYQMRMEAEGFEVQHCDNGETALQAAKEFKPHLVLLDIMMPRLNGFDVLDILRNTPETKNIKIVVLSAMSQPADQERAKDLGADDYLIKSQVIIADVMARVRQHLDLPSK